MSIITFNYDIALDFALGTLQLHSDYGLPKKQNWDNTIKLLKLHGSLNWGRVQKNEDIVCFSELADFARQQAMGLTAQPITTLNVGIFLKKLIKDRFQIDIEPAPVIVPPGFYKAEHHEALRDIWRAAARKLADAEDIIVIGFSLPTTDSFFNHLYALGTEGTSSIRKFWVFNPDTEGSVEKRFRAMLGFGASSHFQYFPLTFDLAVNELAFQYFGDPLRAWFVERPRGEPYFPTTSFDAYSKTSVNLSSKVR